MEVVAPIARSPDFHFRNTTFYPYSTAPLSPIPFSDSFNYQYQHYTSAPASPAQVAAIYSQSTAWVCPTPNTCRCGDNDVDVFDFTFSPSRYHQPISHRSPEVISADKLFEKGRIQPLLKRGRNSLAAKSLTKGSRKSRSLSPSRDVEFLAKNTSPSANPVKCGLSRKWPRLKDLLLFRSSSEGRATGRGSKDPLQKYTILPFVSSVNTKRACEDKKTGSGEGGETVRRVRQPAISAHEKHYMENRAAAEEQKWKTALPFQRHCLLSFVDLSPTIRGKNKLVSASSFSKRGF